MSKKKIGLGPDYQLPNTTTLHVTINNTQLNTIILDNLFFSLGYNSVLTRGHSILT